MAVPVIRLSHRADANYMIVGSCDWMVIVALRRCGLKREIDDLERRILHWLILPSVAQDAFVQSHSLNLSLIGDDKRAPPFGRSAEHAGIGYGKENASSQQGPSSSIPWRSNTLELPSNPWGALPRNLLM
jgi:hypothetical protein